MSLGIKMDREQIINIFNVLKKVLIRDDDAQAMMETLIRSLSTQLAKGAKMAILLLDESQTNLIGAFLLQIGPGGIPRIPDGIESIESIDLNLGNDTNKLKDLFKAGVTRDAAKIASQIIEGRYGALWTTVVIDVKKISELFDTLYPGGVKGDSVGKIVRMTLDKSSKGEILLEPIPGFITTLQKIFGQ
jgi:hypothetical protein